MCIYLYDQVLISAIILSYGWMEQMDPLQGLKPSVVCLSPLKWVEPFCISKPPHAREEENDRKLLGGPEEEGVYECKSK